MRNEETEFDAVHRALCANHLTHDVANFLTDLYARIRKLEMAYGNCTSLTKRGKSCKSRIHRDGLCFMHFNHKEPANEQ